MDWRTPAWLASLAISLTVAISEAAEARSLEIQFSGLDLVYDGSDLYDATSVYGGRSDPAKADPLTAVTFLLDGEVVGTQTSDVWADVFIADVTGIPADGGSVTSGGNHDTFGIDIHTSLAGWGLALNLDTVDIFYVGNEIAIGGGAAASSVAYQDLPFDLVLDESDTVTIAFSSGLLSGVTDDGTVLTGFSASGTGNMGGMAIASTPPVPEPSTCLLLLLGVVGLVGGRRRTTV